MPLTSVQGKLRASAPYSIFYVDSLHVAWILYQVPPKSLCSSIYIELIVALASTHGTYPSWISVRLEQLSSLRSSHWKFRRPPSPVDYSVLLNNLCLVLPPQMHFARLRLFANTVPTAPFKVLAT
ncbi:hypothetical protein B296_00027565 [Ensete ventricosum]|uniref:Uncharacterized protein n=1 Tax=Ensete ventricosum TaxID=4639 RepID=A0A426YWB3_ENSVE|nr:hypothetical protein B296_00027565 [Ensete ventricosum]